MPEEDAGIGERNDDIWALGRSPLWDGDPAWDRQLFYDNPDNRNAPSDITGQFKSLGLTALATEPAPVDVITCGYCGEELPFILPEDSGPHRCWGGFIPGHVAKLPDGKYVIILEVNEKSVVYYEVPLTRTVGIEKFLKDTE